MKGPDERRRPPASPPLTPADEAPVPDEPAAIERQAQERDAIERESAGGEISARDSIELPAEGLPERELEGEI